jgi:hypothetical protein
MISGAMAEMGGITLVRIPDAMNKNAMTLIRISGAMVEKGWITPVRISGTMPEKRGIIPFRYKQPCLRKQGWFQSGYPVP